MKNFKLLIVLSTLFAAACGSTTPIENRQTVNSAATNSTIANAASAKVKTGRGIGIVKAIDLNAVTVELDHEEIKGMMPAMPGMIFNVADKSDLEKLKPNDKVDFTLQENENREEKIIRIVKAE